MTGNTRKYFTIFLVTLLLLTAAPSAAFAATCPGEHSFAGWQTRTEPTCSLDGMEVRTCTACGEEETRTIFRLGHDFATEYTVDLEPTCTEPGRKSQHCSRCGEKKNITVLEATGHTPGEWYTEIEATCTQYGLCNRFCLTCSALIDSEMLDKKSHGSGWVIVTPSTCSQAGSESYTCPDCGLVHSTAATPALPHTPSDWITDAVATCTTAGSRHIECTGCGEITETEVLPATGHSFCEWATVREADCTAPGTRSRTCDTCGTVEAQELPALPHTDTNEDRICDTCGEKMTGYNFITAIFKALTEFFHTIIALFR